MGLADDTSDVEAFLAGRRREELVHMVEEGGGRNPWAEQRRKDLLGVFTVTAYDRRLT